MHPTAVFIKVSSEGSNCHRESPKGKKFWWNTRAFCECWCFLFLVFLCSFIGQHASHIHRHCHAVLQIPFNSNSSELPASPTLPRPRNNLSFLQCLLLAQQPVSSLLLLIPQPVAIFCSSFSQFLYIGLCDMSVIMTPHAGKASTGQNWKAQRNSKQSNNTL